MNVTPKNRRNRFTCGIVYLSILLLGAASGLGLSISVTPEKKPRPIGAYKILIFESPEPKNDFLDYFRLMDLICNPSTVSVAAGGPNYFSKIFGAQNRLKTSFMTVNNRTAYLDSRYQLDIEGKEKGRGFVTEITFRRGARTSRQHFLHQTNHLQLIELDRGPPATFAIVHFDKNSTVSVSGPNYRTISRDVQRRQP